MVSEEGRIPSKVRFSSRSISPERAFLARALLASKGGGCSVIGGNTLYAWGIPCERSGSGVTLQVWLSNYGVTSAWSQELNVTVCTQKTYSFVYVFVPRPVPGEFPSVAGAGRAGPFGSRELFSLIARHQRGRTPLGRILGTDYHNLRFSYLVVGPLPGRTT